MVTGQSRAILNHQPQDSPHTIFIPHAHSFPCSLSHLQGTPSPCSTKPLTQCFYYEAPLPFTPMGVFLPRILAGMSSTYLYFALCGVQLSSLVLVSQVGWKTRQGEPCLLCLCTLSHCVSDPELERHVCEVTSVMSASLQSQGL